MHVAVAVGSIQGKSRLTVLKGSWDISSFKNPQEVVPLPNQPNQYLILRLSYVFVIQSQTICICIFFIIFIDDQTYLIT